MKLIPAQYQELEAVCNEIDNSKARCICFISLTGNEGSTSLCASVAQRLSLQELLATSDFVCVSVPLNADTEKLIDSAALKRMKPNGILINISRGKVIDEQALIEALNTGQIGAAGLDVFEQEPLPSEHPLWTMDNVLMSAHMAGDFIGWRDALDTNHIGWHHAGGGIRWGTRPRGRRRIFLRPLASSIRAATNQQFRDIFKIPLLDAAELAVGRPHDTTQP